MQQRKRNDSAFSVPLLGVVLLGSAICIAFYLALQTRFFANSILVRYAMCHWVAVASVWLFCMASVSLAFKFWAIAAQWRLATNGQEILQSAVESRHELDSAMQMDPLAMCQWLDTLWRSQTTPLVQSWMGQRVSEFLSRQWKRRTTLRMDEDLRELSDLDHDTQHASHGLIRIICWAMPMLGFLGTVLGISDTLGHMDAQALASGSQEAMNSLTSGLYVAFDTTAVGLVLTMIAMFIQFAVQRMESRLLQRMDSSIANAMHECLSIPQPAADTSGIEQLLRAMTDGWKGSVEQLIEQQAVLWRDSMLQAHATWQKASDSSIESAKSALLPALQQSLSEYRDAMRGQSEELIRLQAEGAQQIDARLQQWQTTISEQARASLRQQQEMNRNAELLQKLLDSTQLVDSMRGPVEATLQRLTDIDRFHDAAVCIVEAVALLSSQMERLDHQGRTSVRRRGPETKLTETSPPTLHVVGAEDPKADKADKADNAYHADEAAPKSSSFWKRRTG